VRRTFAMAFSPCLEKSISNAQITASLNLLREPRIRPAGSGARHRRGSKTPSTPLLSKSVKGLSYNSLRYDYLIALRGRPVD